METTNTHSILVIKDGPEPFELDQDLRRSGDFGIIYRGPGQNINDCMTTNDPDFVILDLQVVQSKFIEALQVIRKYSSCPIMAVLPPHSQFDEAVLLEKGADTVIPRPYDSRILLAHIGSQLRRLTERTSVPDSKHNSNTEPRPTPDRIQVGTLTIDRPSRSARINGDEKYLTTAEFDVLWLLARNPGRAVSRDEIYSNLYGMEYDGLNRSIDLRMARLRRKLGDNAAHARRIKSIRSIGYMLIVD